MTFRAIGAAFALALTAAPAFAQQPPAPIVFFDIAGPDMAKQRSFYATVFGWTSAPEANGASTMSVPVTPQMLDGALRKEPAEKVIYLGVEDVTATLDKVVANGGKIRYPRFEVKGVVVLGLFHDPAGNVMGLVEMKDGKAKIP